MAIIIYLCMMLSRDVFIAGTALAMIAVIMGAFGAHGLKPKLSQDQINVFETAVKYQFYHSLALIITALLARHSGISFNITGICFLIGIILFSGSLYLISCKDLLGISNIKWIGPITPIGGLFFIAGWLTLLIKGIKAW